MAFRVATLNLEQDHKRWEQRRELVIAQLGDLRPDIFTLNEVSVPLQTARWIQQAARERLDLRYALIQQTKVNSSSEVDGEAILTRFPVLETCNLDYRAWDAVAQVARLEVEGRQLDVYVTHLHRSRGEDPLRQYQVQRLLEWVGTREDVAARVACGDFNATLDRPSAQDMAAKFRPTQTKPTAFTPLEDSDGSRSHPYWERMDRCIDYVWISGSLSVQNSGVCFNRPSDDDPTLWPSDHAGVWADLEFSG
ncbi:MAG: endonuclease/exonuclease/phosphatase family protein [Dehalococcoidia bacterium]